NCTMLQCAYPSSLSLHDALPIYWFVANVRGRSGNKEPTGRCSLKYNRKLAYAISVALASAAAQAAIAADAPADEEQASTGITERSEEHTSELQSRGQIVCRLMLE